MISRVLQAVSQIAPTIVDALLPPASQEHLSQLQELVGRPLPADLIEMYSYTAGMDPNASANFAYAFVLTDISSTIRKIKAMPSAYPSPLAFSDPGISRSPASDTYRIEIGHDNARCQILVDLDPVEQGTYGQVIFIDRELDVGLTLAGSVRDYFEDFHTHLISGKYSLQQDALDDGVEWLKASTDIDIGNWFKSPKWLYAKPNNRN